MSPPPVYSFAWLCQSMQQRQIVSLTAWSGKTITGLINGISVEDGSGRHFLVKMSHGDHPIYVRAE